MSISPFFDLVLHTSGAYKTSVFSSAASEFVVVSLAEFFSEAPSVAANSIVTKVKSNKHVATGRRRTHEDISMVFDVFCTRHLYYACRLTSATHTSVVTAAPHACLLLIIGRSPTSPPTLLLSPQRDKIQCNITPHCSTVLTPPAVKQVRANGYNFLINLNFNTSNKRRGSSVNIVTTLRVIRVTSQNTRK